MILDQESHRVALLQLIEQATIPGSQIDAAYDLKRAIVTAVIVNRAAVQPDLPRPGGANDGDKSGDAPAGR